MARYFELGEGTRRQALVLAGRLAAGVTGFSTGGGALAAPLQAKASPVAKKIAPSRKPTVPFSWTVKAMNGQDYVPLKNLRDFYQFTELDQDGSSYVLRSPKLVMRLRIGAEEVRINNVKFMLSVPLAEVEGQGFMSRVDLAKLIDPVLRPSRIAQDLFDTVVIDPGHGGHDSGGPGMFGNEKDYALDVGLRMGSMLQRFGLKVKLTRTTDVYPSLPSRTALANSLPRSIFVSLHFNHGPAQAHGIETYAIAPAGTTRSRKESSSADAVEFHGNERDAENIALATAVHAAVLFHLKPADRGIMRDRWLVLKGLERPGILFEGGFVTNPEEAAKINDGLYRARLAAALAQGIFNYRKALVPR
jgi:N-acetylmuramoyl-L-alanine amidase